MKTNQDPINIQKTTIATIAATTTTTTTTATSSNNIKQSIKNPESIIYDNELLSNNIICKNISTNDINTYTINNATTTINNNDTTSTYRTNHPIYVQSNLYSTYIDDYINMSHIQPTPATNWDINMLANTNFIYDNNISIGGDNTVGGSSESTPILTDNNHYIQSNELIYDSSINHTQNLYNYPHDGYYLINNFNQEAWLSPVISNNNTIIGGSGGGGYHPIDNHTNFDKNYNNHLPSKKYNNNLFTMENNQNIDNTTNFTFDPHVNNTFSTENENTYYNLDRNRIITTNSSGIYNNQISNSLPITNNNLIGQYFNIPDVSVIVVGDQPNTMTSSTPDVAQSQNYTHKPLVLSSSTAIKNSVTGMNGKTLSIPPPNIPSSTVDSIMIDNKVIGNDMNQTITNLQSSLSTTVTTTSNEDTTSNTTISVDDSPKINTEKITNPHTTTTTTTTTTLLSKNCNNNDCTLVTAIGATSTDYKNVESIVNKILVPMKYNSYNDIIDLDNQFYKLNLENMDENYYQRQQQQQQHHQLGGVSSHINYYNTSNLISDMITPITNYTNIQHNKSGYPIIGSSSSSSHLNFNVNNNTNSTNPNISNNCTNTCNNSNNNNNNNQISSRNGHLNTYTNNHYVNTRKIKYNPTNPHRTMMNSPQMINIPTNNGSNNNNNNNNNNNTTNIPSNSPYMARLINPNNCYVVPGHVVNNPDIKTNSNLPLIDKVNKLEAFRNNIASFSNMTLKDIQGWIVDFSRDQHGSRFIQQKMEKSANGIDRDIVFKEIITTDTVLYTLMTDVFGNYVVQKMLEYGNDQQKRVISTHLKDRVLVLTTQMYGCRVIQKAIECIPKDIQTDLIHELDGHVLECVKDQNGNHVIQKCIEHVPAINLDFIISEFNGRVFELSSHPYGCRVIQRLMEHCAADQTHNLMLEIFDNLPSLVKDQYGNYVIQHILDHRKHQDFPNRIISYVFDNIFTLSAHKFASNVVEKCIQFSSMSQKDDLIKFILRNSDGGCNDNLYMMMKDPFANYVVQKIVDSVNGDIRKQLLLKMKPYFINLKKLTYGKHMINKVDRWLKETETMTSFIRCEEEFPSLNSSAGGGSSS